MATPENNNNALYIKGCLGCFGIMFLFLMTVTGIGGYLYYLEETALDDHSNEVMTTPVMKRGVTTLRIDKKGNGYRRFNMWVRGPGLLEANGEVKCNKRKYARPFSSKKGHYRSKTDGPDKHVWMQDIYLSSHAKPANCVVTFTKLTGKGPFEIVVTQSQRPSDRFSF